MNERLQRRLAVLFGLSFWMYALLFLGVFLAYENLPQYEPANVQTQHAIAIALFALVLACWFVARSDRPLSQPTLSALDWAFVLVTGPHFGVQTYLNADRLTPPLLLLVYAAIAAMSRAVIVPSTTRRTAMLSAVAMAGWAIPAIIAVATGLQRAPEFPPSMVIPFIIILSVAVTALAAGTSSVIHKLQTQLDDTTRAGAYQLGRPLGKGASGDVFLARHASHRHPLAVKVIERVDREGIRRLEDVLSVTSRLHHPGVARIHDYGPSSDGSFYCAMELIDGIDLDTLVREHGALPVGRAVAIVVQLCRTLGAAHREHVVHRDVKPANVIVTRRCGAPETAILVDFGIVEPVDADGQLSSGDVVAGTPGYMAPEAFTDPEDVGPASDLYSLGALAYFLLTGRTVFDGTTVAEMCAQHIHTEPKPVSARAPGTIPPELDELILSCLAKKPDERPAIVEDLCQRLEEISADDWSEQLEDRWWADHDARRADDPHSSPLSVYRALLPMGPSP